MRFRTALSMLILACMLAAARMGHAASSPPASVRDLWVEVRVNKVPQADYALVHVDLRGHLWARSEDMRAWHLNPTTSGATTVGLVRIDDFPGVHAKLEADDTLLVLDADPSLFKSQIFGNGGHPLEAPDRGVPALFLGGRAWPAQTLTGPAALLVVPGLGGVEVLHDGQLVGRTDDEGRILVPSLRPFEDNTLTIIPEDVPVGALIESDRSIVRPYSHGIVNAVMSVAASQSQVFQLLLAPGIFVPPGAEIQLNGHSFPVGTEGLAQVPLAHAAADGMVNWPGGRCELHVPAAAAVKPGTEDPIVTTCGRP